MRTVWTDLMGCDVRQSFYDVKGVRTRCIEAGDGPVLVFLHGTGGHAEAYARNVIEHAKYFHVYSLDMIGHGFTGAPDCNYDIEDFAGFVRDFLDTIGARRACISGESLGAMTTQYFATKWPDRVEKIVLNTGILHPPDEPGRRELLEVLERTRAAAGAAVSRDAVRKRLEWLMYEPDKSVTEELVEIRYRIYSQPGRAEITRKIGEHVLTAIVSPEFARTYCKPETIEVPTLLLWTRHNPGQSLAVAQAGRKYLANCKTEVMERSAHWPQWEEPDVFNRLHLDFLLK